MVRLPGIAMLGYVAAHSETLAMAVIMSKGTETSLPKLIDHNLIQKRCQSTGDYTLRGARGSHQRSYCLGTWPDWWSHARTRQSYCRFQCFAKVNANESLLGINEHYFRLLESYTSPESSEDLQTKSKAALKKILQKCVYLPALEPLLHDAPSNILQHVVAQYSKVLPHDPAARRLFVTSGGLKKVQEIKSEPETALCEYIREINTCFPEEIVRYYSPGYSEQLLQRVECYKPSDGCQTISVPDNLCKEGINTSPSQN